jgi:ubiquitin-like protein Nedd8
MQIWVKTLIGTKVDFNVDEDATALHLKQLLEEKQGIQVDQIRLIYKGKQLNDEDKLVDKQVTAGAVVHMVLQL